MPLVPKKNTTYIRLNGNQLRPMTKPYLGALQHREAFVDKAQAQQDSPPGVAGLKMSFRNPEVRQRHTCP